MIGGIILGLWLLAMPIRILVKLLRGSKLEPCLRMFFLDLVFTGPIIAVICYFSFKGQ
jgi:hypothetical protein